MQAVAKTMDPILIHPPSFAKLANLRLCHNYKTIILISKAIASKVSLHVLMNRLKGKVAKISTEEQLGLKHLVTHEGRAVMTARAVGGAEQSTKLWGGVVLTVRFLRG